MNFITCLGPRLIRRPAAASRAIAPFMVMAAIFSLVAQPQIALAEGLELGLYKDGQLIQSLETYDVPKATNADVSLPAPARKSRALKVLQHPVAAVAPAMTDEAQRRIAVVAQANKTVKEIQSFLKQMKANQGAANDRQQLETLIQKFAVEQEEVRSVLVGLADEVAKLGLDKIIVDRQAQTMRDFEAQSASFKRALEDVVSGKPNALDNALLYLEQTKFENPPSVQKRAPTYQLHMREAPRLTRDQANALNAKTASAQSASSGKVPLPEAKGPRQPGPKPAGPVALTSPPTAADLAATVDVQITQAIKDKAAALGNSPLAIYEFVRNNISFQPYVGSRKGSDYTLQQLAGNDTDQASLLLALLRAAGIPSRYVRGSVEMTPDQAKSWLGVDDAGTAGNILTTADLDGVNIVNGPNVVAIQCTRVWVMAYIPYSNYRGVPNDNNDKTWVPLDPAFKGTVITPGEDVLTPMSFNTDNFLADYLSTFHTKSPVEKFEADIQTWLNVNRPGKTVADVERSVAVGVLNLGLVPASLPYQLLSISGSFSELEDAKRYKVRFYLHDSGTALVDYTINLTQLAGHRFNIAYVGATAADQAVIAAHGGIYQTPPNLVNVQPVIKLDDVVVATSANSIGMGLDHESDMYFIQPAGAQNQQPIINNTITAGNSQAIAFDTFLDTVSSLFSWGDFGSGPAAEAVYQPTAALYLSRVDDGLEQVASLMRMTTVQDVSEAIVESAVKVEYSFGIPITFQWTGLIVDADRRIVGPFAVDGSAGKTIPYMKLTGYDGSTMENRIFEDTFNERALSTIKILETANDTGIGICTITTSIASDCPSLNQPASVISAINSALAQGHQVTITKAQITIGQWSGTGYIDLDPTTGAGGYIISGGISGNVLAAGGATVDVWPISLGCEAIPPITGTISPNGFADGDNLCADNSQISYTVTLQYDCKDAQGNVTHKTFGPTSHTVPPTKLTIVKNFGPGKYTISIPGTQVQPVSFTLVYVHFTKTEDTTCWQKDGTYDAKALLSADSTKDDALLAWTGATISAAGQVKFDAAGATYTIKVTAGGLAGCSDSFKLNVVQITSTTVATTPADQTRTDIGVGEDVNLKITPAIAAATWSASTGKVNPASGATTTFTAGDAAGNSVITVNLPVGSCTKTFNIVTPTTVTTATVASANSYPKNQQGAGMHLYPVIIGPTTVSFYNLQAIEVGKNASAISGYFIANPPISHIGNGADVWFNLDQKNAWPANWDYATLFNWPQPWSAGGFTWDIPANWRIGAAGAVHAMTGWNQVFSITGTNGTTTILKFGHGVTRTTNDVSTTF